MGDIARVWGTCTNDGEFVLYQYGDCVAVTKWGLSSIERKLVIEGDAVLTFEVGPDGNTAVTAHRSGLLRQWSLSDGVLTRTWKSLHTGPIVLLAFDSTTTLVASTASDSIIKVWDIVKQYCTHSLKGSDGIVSVMRFYFQKDRQWLVGASRDLVLRIWDLTSSTLKYALAGHMSTVTGIEFTPNFQKMISVGRDKVIILWNMENITQERTIPLFEAVEGLCLLEDSVVTAGERGVLRKWNLVNGSEVKVAAGESCGQIVKFFRAKSKKCLVSVSTDQILTFYDDTSLEEKFHLVGHNDDILDITWLPGASDPTIVVATNSKDIKIYNLATNECHLLKGHTDLVLAVATCSTVSNLIVSASKDNTIRLWHKKGERFECVAIGSGHTASVGTVAISHRKGQKFLISGSQDMCIKRWETTNLADDEIVHLRASHTVLSHEKDVNFVAISPNDKYAASASGDKVAKIWNASDLSLAGTLSGHRRSVWCVQFSNEDMVVATGSADSTIKIWSLADFSCIKTLEGHDSSVLRLAWISSGTQLISSSASGLVKVWTLKVSECALTLDAHNAKVWAMAVSPDCMNVATGSGDSNITIWRDTTEEKTIKKAEEEEKRIEDEQLLSNLLLKGKYKKALGLAIRLDQPFRALSIIKEILILHNIEELSSVVEKLRVDQKDSLLRYATTWNTNSKHCFQAQAVLSCLLRSMTPDELLELPNFKACLEGFIPYTERHMARLNRLQQSSTFLEYASSQVKLSAMNFVKKEEIE
ncbi:transducin beta-like protein 3 [Artemia franciscana]|uniref:transducin beta-like protein 3 n=1 Tax=Artemia franciscana TaxID=6661 RepID=UPI0032DA88B6